MLHARNLAIVLQALKKLLEQSTNFEILDFKEMFFSLLL
jgi:hypothetical protein